METFVCMGESTNSLISPRFFIDSLVMISRSFLNVVATVSIYANFTLILHVILLMAILALNYYSYNQVGTIYFE